MCPQVTEWMMDCGTLRVLAPEVSRSPWLWTMSRPQLWSWETTWRQETASTSEVRPHTCCLHNCLMRPGLGGQVLVQLLKTLSKDVYRKCWMMKIWRFCNSFSICVTGCPSLNVSGCENPTLAFQGCMRLFSINSQPMDLNLVHQGRLGDYKELQFDTCGIHDRLDFRVSADVIPSKLRYTNPKILVCLETKTKRYLFSPPQPIEIALQIGSAN